MQIAAFVLLIEILPSPFHLQASILWFTCKVVASVLVYLLLSAMQNWRYLQLSIAVPSFAFFTYIFVIPRSPLWITVVKQNIPEATQILSQFGKFNGKVVSANQLNQHIHNLFASSTSSVCSRTASFDHITPVESTSGTLQHSLQHQSSSLPSAHSSSLQQQKQLVQPKLSDPGPILRWYLLTHFYIFFVLAILRSELIVHNALVLHQSANINSIYNSFLDLGIIILAYHLALWFGGKTCQVILFLLNGLLILASIVLTEYLKSYINSGTCPKHPPSCTVLIVDSIRFQQLLDRPSTAVGASLDDTVRQIDQFHSACIRLVLCCQNHSHQDSRHWFVILLLLVTTGLTERAAFDHSGK